MATTPSCCSRSPPRRARARGCRPRSDSPAVARQLAGVFASLDTTVGSQGYEIALLNIDAPIEMRADGDGAAREHLLDAAAGTQRRGHLES